MTALPKGTPYYGGQQVPNPANVIQSTAAPNTHDVDHNVGTLFVNTTTPAAYILTQKTAGSATWTEIDNHGGTGTFTSLVVTGTTTLTGATNINTSGTADTVIGVGSSGEVRLGTTAIIGSSLYIAPASSLDSLANAVGSCSGTTGAMTAGAVVVPSTLVSANSIGFFTTNTLGTVTTPQRYYISARTPGVSFTITSSDGTDTSTVNWFLINSRIP